MVNQVRGLVKSLHNGEACFIEIADNQRSVGIVQSYQF